MQDPFGIPFGRGDFLQDRVEENSQIAGLLRRIELRDSGLRVGVDDREIELVLGGIQIDEQIVDLVEHFLNAGIRAVDLVDHHDRSQPRLQGFHQHVAGLRQGTFAGIHQQHDAVHDLERALDLAAEIAVAGRVDDVDLDVVIPQAGGLGQDGDAALALQFVRIHHALDHRFVGPEKAALAEHGVYKGGFAVVNVGNDGHVANLFVCSHGNFHGRTNGLKRQ